MFSKILFFKFLFLKNRDYEQIYTDKKLYDQ